jgi:glycosyltransferase involved in cell wall biosynthesis
MTLRILWASDAPDATSGYSNQTRLIAPRLAALGHDVALLATFGHHGAVREWQGLRVYPGGADAFANDVIAHSAQDWQADIVITLKDSHVFHPQALQGCRWVPMTPVDHEPLPAGIAERLHYAYRPIAYAPNGFRELRKAGFDPLYCPHGFDPAVYKPAPRSEARAFLQMPEEWFVVGTVAVNRGGVPSRKAWAQNLEAFAAFARDKPNARYFIHTDLCADGYEGGVNLTTLCAKLGIQGKVLFCDQTRYRRGGFPENYMHALYCACDVVNCVSLGEGFGIPAMEAQACGTPVIVSDFAAHRDLCFGGWKVGDGQLFYDQQDSYVFLPDVQDIASALEGAYCHVHCTHEDGQWDDLATAAVSGIAPYAIDRVIAEHWVPALAELERDIRETASRGVLRIIRKEEVWG